MTIDHELMESLEYKGEYGMRYTCGDCRLRRGNITDDYALCEKSGVNVYQNNNVCRAFQPRIKNPSSPEFDYDDYLEYLGSDFYRPWSADTNIIVGSAKLGEAIADGGKLAELLPKTYSPLYKSYDKPYCHNYFPRCHVEVESDGIRHRFEIDYKRYRECKTVENGAVHFVEHIWKEKPKQRRYNKETYGEYKITEANK